MGPLIGMDTGDEQCGEVHDPQKKKKRLKSNAPEKLITNLNVPNSAGGKTGVDWQEWLGRLSERLTKAYQKHPKKR